jgi:hypothetical protein
MKVVLPAHNEPITMPDGSMNPTWYAFFSSLLRRGVLDLPDVDNSTPITNAQVLVWDSTAAKFKPGAN